MGVTAFPPIDASYYFCVDHFNTLDDDADAIMKRNPDIKVKILFKL